MLVDVQYSLIRHITDHIDGYRSVEWIIDGEPAVKPAGMPFATVEWLFDGLEKPTKDNVIQSTFRFQVAVHAADEMERLRLVEDTKILLAMEPAVLYGTNTPEPVERGYIEFWVNDVTPIGAANPDDVTDYGKTYLDVSAVATYRKQ